MLCTYHYCLWYQYLVQKLNLPMHPLPCYSDHLDRLVHGAILNESSLNLTVDSVR
jgi:hypothetical protein